MLIAQIDRRAGTSAMRAIDPEVPLQASELGAFGLLGPESTCKLADLVVIDGPVWVSEVFRQ